MPAIKNLQQKYFSKISPLDLEILISHAVKKPREFILAHPEYKLSLYQVLCIKYYAWQRSKKRPIAYITGHKEFYGLDFKVNKNVLIPRPETELLVESLIQHIQSSNVNRQMSTVIIDIGTGCGNIIISVVKNLPCSMLCVPCCMFYASDISPKALQVARQNAKKHKVDKKIKFLQGDLLKPIMKVIRDEKLEIGNWKLEILSNLPYLSKGIYDSASADVKKYEPKNALYSPKNSLEHYENLFKQIKKLRKVVGCLPTGEAGELQVVSYLEFSPEQKNKLAKLIKNYFPRAKTKFKKDLAGKWRVCQIEIS